MKSVQIGSSAWSYEEAGTGPVVVFVHGFPMDHRIWVAQLAGLAGVCRVIAVDLKGFGKSRGSEAFTIDSMADDLAVFLRAVKATPCVLVGLSMGGYISFSVALRHPEVLKGLVIVSSRASADAPQAREGRQKMAELAQREGSGAVADQMLPKVLGAATMAAGSEVVMRLREIMESCPPLTIANASFAMRDRADRTAELPSLAMPVLVVLGDQDGLIPVSVGQEMACACARGELAVVSGAGHMAPMESPEKVNAILGGFVEKVNRL